MERNILQQKKQSLQPLVETGNPIVQNVQSKTDSSTKQPKSGKGCGKGSSQTANASGKGKGKGKGQGKGKGKAGSSGRKQSTPPESENAPKFSATISCK